jgi:tetratricopeptide (TPR) repeat protein
LLISHCYELLHTGYFEEALQFARRIIALDPLHREGYIKAGGALRALGRYKEARDLYQNGIELGLPKLIGDIASVHFLSGEFELAIAADEDFLEIIGADPGLARELVDGALNQETGKKFLDEFKNRRDAEGLFPYGNSVYLYFGYIDEFWEIAKSMESDTLGPWKGGFELRMSGTVSGIQEFRSHPYYITQEKIDLWDKRGAPDTCSKSSGQWVCN